MDDIETRVHGIKLAQATQTAAMAGTEATQTAAMTGVMSTNAAMQAGTMATLVAGGASMVVGSSWV
jgi:hypothetical protein